MSKFYIGNIVEEEREVREYYRRDDIKCFFLIAI